LPVLPGLPSPADRRPTPRWRCGYVPAPGAPPVPSTPEGVQHLRPAAGGTTASNLPVRSDPRGVIRGSPCCHDDVVVRSPVGPTSTACPRRRDLPEGRPAPPARCPGGLRRVEVPALPSWPPPGPRVLRRGHLTCGFSRPWRVPSPAVLDLSISMW